jgi:hypothetical protein
MKGFFVDPEELVGQVLLQETDGQPADFDGIRPHGT